MPNFYWSDIQCIFASHFFRAGIFKRLWGLGTGEEEGYRTGPPGYIGWWNSFLGIDSGAPYTFKNTSTEYSPFPLVSEAERGLGLI